MTATKKRTTRKPRIGVQVSAFRKMVAAAATGAEHAGLVALGEGLAKMLDDGGAPEWVWREYRQVLKALFEVTEVEAGDDMDRLLAELGRRASKVRDAAD